MLGWRLLISAILIPAFIGLCYVDAQLGPSAPILLCITLLTAVRSARELVALLSTRSFDPSFVQTALLSSLLVVSAWVPHIEGFNRLVPTGVDPALVFGL